MHTGIHTRCCRDNVAKNFNLMKPQKYMLARLQSHQQGLEWQDSKRQK